MNKRGNSYSEEEVTDEILQKVARYLKAGWRLSTAMNQCNVASSKRNLLLKKLQAIGVKETPSADSLLNI